MKNWRKHFDEFNDRNFWMHDLTQEIRWYEPKLEHFLPSGWIHPEPPRLDNDDSEKKIKYNYSDGDTIHCEPEIEENKDESISTDESTESKIRSADLMNAKDSRGYEVEVRAAALSLISRRRSLLKKKPSHEEKNN